MHDMTLTCICYTIWSHYLNSSLFFFNDTATTEIYTLSLHDALPILATPRLRLPNPHRPLDDDEILGSRCGRSEEHTSELQSQSNLVCRLLLEKKKKKEKFSPKAHHKLSSR